MRYLEAYLFVKTIRYLLLIYVIPINDFVLEKRRMVFIYLPYSSGAVLMVMRYALSFFKKMCV